MTQFPTLHQAIAHLIASRHLSGAKAVDVAEPTTFAEAVDILEYEDRFEFKVDAPGCTAEHIALDVTEHHGAEHLHVVITPPKPEEGDAKLVYLGRNHTKRHACIPRVDRNDPRGTELDLENAKADLKLGVLLVTVPKVRPEAQVSKRRIPINTEAAA